MKRYLKLKRKIKRRVDNFYWAVFRRDFDRKIKHLREAKLTYLSVEKMRALVTEITRIEANEIKGGMIEAGCALGGSAILLSKLKNQKRDFSVYDVFETIPAPTSEDPSDVHERYEKIASGGAQGLEGDEYYGYQENLYEKVLSNFEREGVDLETNQVSLVKGLLQDTMKVTGPISFAHIDVDWYDPVKVSLERIYPHLSVGGVIVLDDYYDWGGCRKAVDEFLANNKGVSLDDTAGSLRLYKS